MRYLYSVVPSANEKSPPLIVSIPFVTDATDASPVTYVPFSIVRLPSDVPSDAPSTNT